jgi:hypothetical protein
MWSISHTILLKAGEELSIREGGIMGIGKKQKALDHKQHLKSQREKEQKRKEKRSVGLPPKGKK